MKISYKSIIFLISIILITTSLYAFGEETHENDITTYTESTKTICKNEKCNLVLYSEVRFAKDKSGDWVNVADVLDITKNSDDITFHYDGNKGYFNATFEMGAIYNNNYYSGAEIKQLQPDLEISFPVEIYPASYKYAINISNINLNKSKLENITLTYKDHYGFTVDELKTQKGKFIIKGFYSLLFDDLKNEGYTVVIKKPEKRIYIGNFSNKFSGDSLYLDPTIILNQGNARFTDDSYGHSHQPDNGARGLESTFQPITLVGYNARAYLKFNIHEIIPAGQQIDNATLWVKVTENGAGAESISVHHVSDQNWVEAPPANPGYYPLFTWASQPCGGGMTNSTYCNLTAESATTLAGTINTWEKWKVIDGIATSYGNGDENVSFMLKVTTEDGSGTTNYFHSKEAVNAVDRPFLNITYSEVLNYAPVVQLQFPKDGTNSTAASTTFYYNVSDPDADIVENCSLWLNKNETGFILDQTDDSVIQTINQTFDKNLELGNYTWKVSCYDNMSQQGNSSIWSYDIIGINVAPTIDVPKITPDPAYTDDTLNCSTIAYDVNLGSITIYFDWYNNSIYTAYQNITTTNGTIVSSYLTPGIQNKNEVWNCTVRAFDGEFYSDYESDVITISNTAPTHSNPLLESESNYNGSNEDLTCNNQSTADVDNDEIINVYAWYLDSSPLAVLNLPFESSADDYSGSNNDGVVNGTPQYVTGKYGNALDFDGDENIMVGDIGIGINGPATIEGWFYFEQFAQGSSHKGLHSGLYQHSGDNNIYIPATNELFYVSSNLQLNTWHHIVYTYSGNSATAKLYIDNQKYGVAVQGVGQDIPALTNFLVGDRGYDLFFNGSIDEVKVYDRVLSADEISEHYNLNYDKIKSDETSENDVWKCEVTPNDGDEDGLTKESNTVTIKPNVHDITFNVTSGEDGNSLTGIYVLCNNGWNVASTPSNPYGPIKFYEASYSCEFAHPNKVYYNKTVSFTSDSNKQIDAIMSRWGDMTIEEHNWLEAIYLCLYEGDCRALDLLEEINETTDNLWDQFKPTDESVVLQEDILSNTLSSTQNISINYTIRVPPKAGYSDGDWLPIRIAYWFLDENNETCKDQDKSSDSNRAEKTYCIPLIAELLGKINENMEFRVDLRPNLPSGSYSIVRDIEIDPNQIWIKYGQGVIDDVNVLESNSEADIFLIKNIDEIKEATVEADLAQSSGLNYVTGLATGAVDKAVNEVKAALPNTNIVAIIGMICSLLAVIVICFTVYKIKTKNY